MIRRISVYTLALLATLIIVSVALQAQPLPLQTRHTRDVVVSGEAVSLGRMPANQTMHIVLALGLRHQPELDNFLTELYDPSSSSYRHFLTVEEFTERFGASKEDYQAVMHFAQANGFKVTAGSRNRMIVQVTGTVGAIEKAFHVEMGVYQHPTENRTFFAPDREPSVDLPFQLWSIAGLDNYSIPKPNLTRNPNGGGKNASIGSGPGASFLGSDMRAAYYGTGSLTGAGQTLGLLEYLGTDLADLTTYYKNVNQTLTVPITLVSTDGSPTTCYAKNGCDDTEQTLDMTQACGMAPGMAGLSMYIGGTDPTIRTSKRWGRRDRRSMTRRATAPIGNAAGRSGRRMTRMSSRWAERRCSRRPRAGRGSRRRRGLTAAAAFRRTKFQFLRGR